MRKRQISRYQEFTNAQLILTKMCLLAALAKQIGTRRRASLSLIWIEAKRGACGPFISALAVDEATAASRNLQRVNCQLIIQECIELTKVCVCVCGFFAHSRARERKSPVENVSDDRFVGRRTEISYRVNCRSVDVPKVKGVIM